MTKLLPCPFCGHDSPYFERMGTPRQSCIVECGNCGARHESSDEDERSGWSWNQRAALAQPEQPTCPHIRSSGSGEWATHWCELNGPPAAQPSDAERRLRRLLCIVKHGRSAYMDDGEAQDSSAHPSIDYLRDSLDEIEAKWRLRASATLTAPEPSEAEVAAAMASLYRAMEPDAWPSEDEVTDALRAAAAARGK